MSLNYTVSRTTPTSYEFVLLDGDRFAEAAGEAEAQRLEACVNACADIPTEALVSMNWQLAPVAGAKPLDVAKLILRMNEYREAITKLIDQVQRCNFIDEEGHLLTMNKAYRDLEGLLS